MADRVKVYEEGTKNVYPSGRGFSHFSFFLLYSRTSSPVIMMRQPMG